MKIAFLGVRVPGHLNPMTTLARPLKARGHDVAFLSVPDTEPFVRAAELPFIPFCGNDFPVGSLAKSMAALSKLQGQAALEMAIKSVANTMESAFRNLPRTIPAIFHDLRRSASTNLLAGGMSPETVRKVVGHLSEEMTARYNQPAMTTLAAQQRKGAELLAAMQSAALPENVIHSSCTVDPQNGERSASSNLLYNHELLCLARVAEWQTLRT
jgi:UDP:flavonoid glycosyltransferase YjiC (YdhE family)